MSIKGTSVEVIVVLVVFPPPLYGAGQKSISLFIHEGSKILSFPFNSGDRKIYCYDRGFHGSAFYLLPYTGGTALNVVREMDLTNQ